MNGGGKLSLMEPRTKAGHRRAWKDTTEGHDRKRWKSREKTKMKCRMNARMEKGHKGGRYAQKE